jgi:hypothetical protein
MKDLVIVLINSILLFWCLTSLGHFLLLSSWIPGVSDLTDTHLVTKVRTKPWAERTSLYWTKIHMTNHKIIINVETQFEQDCLTMHISYSSFPFFKLLYVILELSFLPLPPFVSCLGRDAQPGLLRPLELNLFLRTLLLKGYKISVR